MSQARKILFINVPNVLIRDTESLLADEGAAVINSFGFQDCMQMARIHIPEVFVIAELSDGNPKGLETINELRENRIFDRALILYMTGTQGEESQMKAFNAGAEDLLPLDISAKVLATRISSLIKRLNRSTVGIDLNGNFHVNPESLSVTIQGRHIDLVRKEFELLHLLCSAPNRIFYRKEIFNHIWKGSQLKNDRTLDVHIRKIRKKLGIKNIKTINGVGYKFEWNG